MASIYLIRHGQASFGQENYDQLSELGHRQATRLGEAISQRVAKFDQVYLGTMLRHKQTANNCLDQLSRDLEQSSPVFDQGWNEYDHQDILRQLRPEFATAASLNEFIRQQENPKQAFEQSFNDAVDRWISGQHDQDYVESWSEYTQRVHQALQRVIADSSGTKHVAVFTSGGPISLVGQSLLGVPAEKIMQMNWTLLNCGITKLVSTGSRVFVASLNEHVHFEGADNKQYLTYT